MSVIGRFLREREWELSDEVPAFSRLPTMAPFPTDGSVVTYAAVSNPRGWAMPIAFTAEHYDVPLMNEAVKRLGTLADSPFLGRLVIKDFEHPNPALRGVDYVRAVIFTPAQ